MGGIVSKVGDFLGGLGESEQKQSGSQTGSVNETVTEGGTQSSSGTQQKNPWGQQAPFLQDIWQQAGNNVGWAANNVDPALQQGWQNLEGFAGGNAQDIYSGAQDQVDFLGDTAQLDPATNPFFQANIDAATRAIQDNLGQGLNQIDQQSVGAGNLGGSRQGVAQGQAINEATGQAGDIAAQMALDNYQMGMGNITNAAQMAPMLMELGMIPGQLQGQVGQQRMAVANPWEELMQYGNLVQAGNWGGVTEQSAQQESDQTRTREGTSTGTSQGTQTNQASPLDMFSSFSNSMANFQ